MGKRPAPLPGQGEGEEKQVRYDPLCRFGGRIVCQGLFGRVEKGKIVMVVETVQRPEDIDHRDHARMKQHGNRLS